MSFHPLQFQFKFPIDGKIPPMSSATIEHDYHKNLRYNITVNVLDGSFFGFALGFASFVTIIPLFISQLTDSAILIGFIPALHSFGWQFPQLFTAKWVSRLRRFKPAVLFFTIQERVPFIGLALIAWFTPKLGIKTALGLSFLMLIWQGFGGGFTANPWQSMIAKIIPSERLGVFFGVQSAAANSLASLGAVLAGILLNKIDTPQNFALCFLLAAISMAISWGFLSLTRESVSKTKDIIPERSPLLSGSFAILRRNTNFRWFLVVRILSQFAMMGSAFYTVYAVKHFEMDVITAGFVTGSFSFTQIIANPILGWLSDRWSRRGVLLLGALAGTLSAIMAWVANSAEWFYGVFILTGIAMVTLWTVAMVMTVEFGTESERPMYIGLANTLIAPATLLAPIIGGWLADLFSYPFTFAMSAAASILMVALLHFLVRDP
jgi:MFS family permease